MDTPWQWQPFRTYQRRTLIYLAVWIPTTVLATFLSVLVIGAERGGEAVGFIVFLLIAWNFMRLIHQPCPRCGNPFFKRVWGYNPFAKRCGSCQLSKYG